MKIREQNWSSKAGSSRCVQGRSGLWSGWRPWGRRRGAVCCAVCAHEARGLRQPEELLTLRDSGGKGSCGPALSPALSHGRIPCYAVQGSVCPVVWKNLHNVDIIERCTHSLKEAKPRKEAQLDPQQTLVETMMLKRSWALGGIICQEVFPLLQTVLLNRQEMVVAK